ncbi:MAG TPA: hypothetical protein VIQ30_08475 [Pseudonocardia sp.]
MIEEPAVPQRRLIESGLRYGFFMDLSRLTGLLNADRINNNAAIVDLTVSVPIPAAELHPGGLIPVIVRDVVDGRHDFGAVLRAADHGARSPGVGRPV